MFIVFMTISSFCLFICSNISYVAHVFAKDSETHSNTKQTNEKWKEETSNGSMQLHGKHETRTHDHIAFSSLNQCLVLYVFFTSCIPPKIIWLPDEEKQMNDKQCGIWYSHVEPSRLRFRFRSPHFSRLYHSLSLRFNVFTVYANKKPSFLLCREMLNKNE